MEFVWGTWQGYWDTGLEEITARLRGCKQIRDREGIVGGLQSGSSKV